MDVANTLTGYRRELARVAGVFGDKHPEIRDYVTKAQLYPRDVKDGVQTVAGLAAGAYLWSNHRVLGAIGGASLGRNLPALLDSSTRFQAVTNMAVTGTAILGSLAMPKHPVIGFVIGGIAGNLAVYAAGRK